MKTLLLLAMLQTVNVHVTDGHKQWWQPLPVKSRTSDAKFWGATAASAALTVADVENSRRFLREHPSAREVNPIFGVRPTRARYYVISGAVFVSMAYFSHKYKREDDAFRDNGYPPQHRFVKWWLPEAVNGVLHGVGLLVTR